MRVLQSSNSAATGAAIRSGTDPRVIWLMVAVIGAAWTIASDLGPATFAEGGVVERLSVVFLVLALIAWMLDAGPSRFARQAYVPLTLLLLAERELGDGPAFMDSDILGPAFWTASPGAVHIAAALLIVWLAWSLAALPKGALGGLWRAWHGRKLWPVLLCAGGTMAVVAQGAENGMLPVGTGAALMIEETLELGFACLVFLTVLSGLGSGSETDHASPRPHGSLRHDRLAGARPGS